MDRFDCVVDDPQMGGMGRGEYSTEGFLSGWETGNRFVCQAMLTQHPEGAPLTLPTEKLRRIWEWNRRRAERQEREGESVFVPRILFLEGSDSVESTVVWGDGIPVLIPRVDSVLVGRHELAPRRFFLFRGPDAARVSWEELANLLEGFPRSDEPMEQIEARYDERPDAVGRFVRDLPPLDERPEILAVEQVLDTEVIEEAREMGSLEGFTFGPETE